MDKKLEDIDELDTLARQTQPVVPTTQGVLQEKQAVQVLRWLRDNIRKDYPVEVTAFNTAIRALTAYRNEPCDSCNKAIYWECHFRDDKGSDWHVLEVDYCPDCGRRLEVVD